MDETAHQYDFILTFNSINNDEQKVIEKLQAVGQIMAQYDRQGQARYDVFLRLSSMPSTRTLPGNSLLRAKKRQQKRLETSMDIAKISSGQVVNAPTKGANPQLRLQVLQQYAQGTEQIPAEDVQQRLQQDEKFSDRLSNYRKATDLPNSAAAKCINRSTRNSTRKCTWNSCLTLNQNNYAKSRKETLLVHPKRNGSSKSCQEKWEKK